MEGIFSLDGYKLNKRIYINLQKVTILTAHNDYYTPVIIFDLLDSYFNKKDFSDTFLNKGVFVSLNEKKLNPQDLIVFRLRPTVNLENELKITKKTILGQILNQKFCEKQDIYNKVLFYLQKDIISKLDEELINYGLKSQIVEENIFNFAKLIEIENYIDENPVFFKEQDQYLAKSLIVNLINKLHTKKSKLLLCELPEYALKEDEYKNFLKTLKQCDNIENIIIYTNSENTNTIFRDIYTYHIVKENSVLGFDDYDRILGLLIEKYNYRKSETEITELIINSIFFEREFKQIFENIDENII
jgi:hypothetical protein